MFPYIKLAPLGHFMFMLLLSLSLLLLLTTDARFLQMQGCTPSSTTTVSVKIPWFITIEWDVDGFDMF